MGLLSDIYSWGDSRKRELKGLLADPVGMLEKTVGQLQDSAKERGSLMQQAGWGITSPSTATPEQQRIAQQILADQGAQQAMAAATVWHGSPHKFDKFDSSKIGTGEGAQAYGHGLYLAESPEVAKSYKDVLAGADKVYMVGGKQVDPRFMDAFESNALQQIAAGRTTASALDDLAVQGVGESALSKMKPLLERFEKAGVKVSEVGKGSLYKVDLPDEHIAKMLDWDKPLSHQHPDVQNALAKTKNKQLRAIVDYASTPYSNASLAGEVKTMGEAIKLLGMNTSPAKSSAMLAKQGIPGIRYLDGGSRGTGQGTSNFVIFPGNEGLLKILERNGQALK